MYKFIFIIAVLMFNANIIFSQNTEEATHTVIKGDTLWDLAGKYYSDPWNWPRIWQANKLKISDPHWIYPNQIFVIPDKFISRESQIPKQQETFKEPEEEFTQTEEELVQEEEVVSQEEQIEEVTESQVALPVLEKTEKQVKKYLSAESFVVDEDWPIDGHIAGEKDKKLLISAGDTVYLNIGSDKLHPGNKCTVYRKVGKVRDTKTRQLLGYEIRRIGRLEIMDKVNEKAASAKVTISYEPLKLGDIVKITD